MQFEDIDRVLCEPGGKGVIAQKRQNTASARPKHIKEYQVKIASFPRR